MVFRISKAAVADMVDIGKYTEISFGIDQSNQYLKKLDNSFQILANNPKLGISCDNIRFGYRKYVEGKHIIFYRISNDDKIEIIRIIHQAMDITKYIKNLDN